MCRHRVQLFSVFSGDDSAELLVESISLLEHILAECCKPRLSLLRLNLGIGLVFQLIIKIDSLADHFCEFLGTLVRVEGDEERAIIYEITDDVLNVFLEIS